MQRVLNCLIQEGQSIISKRMPFYQHFLQAFLWSFWTFLLTLLKAFAFASLQAVFIGILEGIFDADLVKEINILSGKVLKLKEVSGLDILIGQNQLWSAEQEIELMKKR